MEEFLEYLTITDSDLKIIKRDLENFSIKNIKELQEFQEIGYFLNKNEELLFIGKESELEFINITLSRKGHL